jgi:LacI family transcriptional regulator
VPRSRRATIADVAAASGVGIGTVSRVINRAAGVREATRLKVLGAIEQLGYRPSHLAAALSRGTSRTVAIVIPHLTRPSSVERLAGALAVLARCEYDTIVCDVNTPAQRDHFLATLVARHRADGVIVVSLPLSGAQLAAFRRAGLPLATVDVAVRGVPHTVVDDIAGGRLATEHLLDLGHRRIGFIGDQVQRAVSTAMGFTSSGRRLAGYRQAVTEAGLVPDDALVRLGPHGPASAQALAAELLALPDPPSAIFATSDTQAMGVLAAAERSAIKVPRQLSVIGFDDIQAAALLDLSTVRQPLERSGAEGAERLCALMRGEPVRPLRQVLELQVVQRASSGPPGDRVAGRPAGADADHGSGSRPQAARSPDSRSPDARSPETRSSGTGSPGTRSSGTRSPDSSGPGMWAAYRTAGRS